MVRLFLEDKNGEKSKEHIDVCFWSIVKAYFLGHLGMLMVVFGAIVVLGLLFMIMGWLVG